MHTQARIFLIVLDSVGIGAAPDADSFGDSGAHTLGHIAALAGLDLPHLQSLGLGNIASIPTVLPVEKPLAYYGLMHPKSAGKDSIAGHWEMAGVFLSRPFPDFCANGFPADLIAELEAHTGRKVIGNKQANGMKIIEELAEEQEKTGALIVYTSVDSTFQIAANEAIIPIEELYDICQWVRARTIREEKWKVGRVIARPYIRTEGGYVRTANRHDYALSPPEPTLLDALTAARVPVHSIGKIKDLFNGRGITRALPAKNNEDGINQTLATIKDPSFYGFSWTNLVDFDSLYGHTRDIRGYKNALAYFDSRLPELLNALLERDILILTADHGNDPSFKGNDHTRESVPLLIYSKQYKYPKALAIQNTFANLGATLASYFQTSIAKGQSFRQYLE